MLSKWSYMTFFLFAFVAYEMKITGMFGFMKRAYEAAPAVYEAAAESSVTFFPASHKAEAFHFGPVSSTMHAPDDPQDEAAAWGLFRHVYQEKSLPTKLLQTSIPRGEEGINLLQDVIPQTNGFVHTVIEAYSSHRALIIRPDDVWLAILLQFNSFVNGNAALLRKHFVTHEGKKKLNVIGGGNRYTADFAAMSRTMTHLIEANIVDPDLRSWIMPTFSTTTIKDTTIYAIVMMSTMKEYFSYEFTLMCGIPQVTLEGTKQDWESLLSRLAKLKEYGKETEDWYRLLLPVISHFVDAYDNPNSPENLDFWNRVAHIEGGGSGPSYLAGWITAFCYFSNDGTPTETMGEGALIDGVTYLKIDTNDVPGGVAEVDVLLDDNDVKFDTVLVAGSVGTLISADENSVRNTVKPLSAWWYLIIGPHEEET